MIKYVLIDLDGTLLDFNAGEREAVKETVLELTGYELNNEELLTFSEINERLFNSFARGEMIRIEFQEARFKELFEIIKVDFNPSIANQKFIDTLKSKANIYPDVIEVLDYLALKYDLMIASNGMLTVQENRLAKGNILHYFKKCYVSSKIGYNKPDIEFFNYIFNDLSDYDPNHYIIIGDRLTTDILGGIRCNMKTILVNRDDLVIDDLIPTYEVKTFDEIKNIL